MVCIGINGFGRIGRRIFRLLEHNPDIQVVAINDLADTKTLSHLLKSDSIHGLFDAALSYNESNLIVNGKSISFSHENHPKDIDWNSKKVDFVIECTGKFKTENELEPHLLY